MSPHLRVTRREAIALLGAGAGVGLASLLRGDVEALGWLQGRGTTAATVAFPSGAIIRTLLKDVPPESLSGGPTLFHEHLSINLSNTAAPHYTADVAMMANEARGALRDGIA